MLDITASKDAEKLDGLRKEAEHRNVEGDELRADLQSPNTSASINNNILTCHVTGGFGTKKLDC
jgi:hypothetical protein